MPDNALTLSPTVIERAVNADPALKSPHTRAQYLAKLTAFEDWRGDRAFTKTLVKTYASKLQAEGLAPNTINQALAAIRWWARTISDMAYDHLPPEKARPISDQASRVTQIKNVTGKRPPRGRHVKTRELSALIRACIQDDTPAGRRDAALFAVGVMTGMRQAELRGLRMRDLKKGFKSIELSILGKGDKHRTVNVVNEARTLLLRWLSERNSDHGYIFCPILRSGEPVILHQMSHEGLRKIFEKRIKLAGVEHLTPHDLRRTFAGNMLDRYDLAMVQDLLGHESANTTSMYDRRPDERKKEAVKDLHIPNLGIK